MTHRGWYAVKQNSNLVHTRIVYNKMSSYQLICFFFPTEYSAFANGLGDLGSIPGRIIPKTSKMIVDTALLNSQQYKVRVKGKVEKSRERSSALPYTLV